MTRFKTIAITALLLNVSGLILCLAGTITTGALCKAMLSMNIVSISLLLIRYQQFIKDLLAGTGVNHDSNGETALRKFIASHGNYSSDIRYTLAAVAETGLASFYEKASMISDENIRHAIHEANNKFVELHRKETENHWITTGVSSISELKHHGNDVVEYARQVTVAVVKFLGANQGGLFLIRDKENDPHFELVSTYAYGKQKYIEKRINPGEGIIGQVFYEKELVYMTEVPGNYVKITSGLGEALPRSICIVPLLWEGDIYGAIEIAAFDELNASKLEYLRKIGDMVGYNLSAIATNQRTEALLFESQKMAEEVRSQEEELRQNMQELQATQEQMRRKQKEMDAVLSSISTVELDLDGNVVEANEIFLGITGYTQQEVQGRAYKSLIPQYGNDPIQYEIMWNSILSGRSFSGEFRIVNKSNTNMWMAGNFTPILNENGQPYKVMVISLFTTQDKEKLLELQEMVSALKNCFPIAEINPDLTFRSANDLFLATLGIKRLELKKTLPRQVLANGSFAKVEGYLNDNPEIPDNVVLDIVDKEGSTKRFNSTLVKIASHSIKNKKGLLILRDTV